MSIILNLKFSSKESIMPLSNKTLYVVDDNVGFDEIDKEIISKNNIEDYCLVFNKIDAYTFVKKDEDDLTPSTKENLSLKDLQNTWIAKIEEGSMFISALNKTNFSDLKDEMYLRIKRLHEIRYPYNNFLY